MNDEVTGPALDRLLWAAKEWFRGWQPELLYISDRRDRELYEAIKALLFRNAVTNSEAPNE